jgi:hypothetical protein
MDRVAVLGTDRQLLAPLDVGDRRWPLDQLPGEGRERWSEPTNHGTMVEEALSAVDLDRLEPAVEI